MNILALDTSAAAATAAVAKEGYLTGEMVIRHGKTHSQKVLPMIEALLKMLDLKPEDLNLLAVAHGPGSFTGLRIGVVTMKSMAYALNIPLVEVSTLMALAYTLSGKDGVICPIMDARNRQVYTGIYRIDQEEISTIHPDMGTTIEGLGEILKKLNTNIHFIGDAVPLYKEFIMKQGIQACFSPDELFTHRASAIARLAWFMQREGNTVDAFHAAPKYIRKSQAERMRDQQAGKKTYEEKK